MKKQKVIAICSGGMDSISMAGMYKDHDLTLMSFDYGQKGVKETLVVEKLARKLDVPFKLIDISFVKDLYGDSNQLTSDKVKVEQFYTPSVVVPLRNALFLQIAMCHACAIRADTILLGSHSDDATEVNGERMYPDCSYEFFKAFEHAMDMGTFKKDTKVKIVTPSTLNLNKSKLIRKGYKALGSFIFESWSCYKSLNIQCGECESCKNRKDAFREAEIEDRTLYGK